MAEMGLFVAVQSIVNSMMPQFTQMGSCVYRVSTKLPIFVIGLMTLWLATMEGLRNNTTAWQTGTPLLNGVSCNGCRY